MPDPKPLDLAKFKLDAYVKVAEVQAKMMEAYANYNFRMMEVLELRVKIETDLFKLQMMRAAFYDFEQARRRALTRVRDMEAKAEKLATSIRQLNHLVLGEVTPATWVAFGWRGFWFLTSHGPVVAATEMAKIKSAAAVRKGKHFFKPSDPTASLDDAPGDINRALVLMDWARKKNVLPRIGSPPYEKFAELIEILAAHATPLLQEAGQATKEAEADLERIRKINWKNVRIEEEKPKSA
jgi:hypothetical protein